MATRADTDPSDTQSPTSQDDKRINKIDKMNSAAQIVDLTGSDSEDEDEQLKMAIALSLQEQSQQQSTPSQSTPSQSTPSQNTFQSGSASNKQSGLNCKQQEIPLTTTPQTNGLGLSSLDRKQMEADRLARLKRKRDQPTNTAISPPATHRNKIPSTRTQSKALPERKQLNPAPLHGVSTYSTPSEVQSKASPHASASATLQGMVYLTSLDKSKSQFISLPELIRPIEPNSVLKSALLSTFIVDFDWLLPHFDTRSVSFIFALHARDDQQRGLLQQNFEGVPNVRLLFPYMGGNVNCMHSKLMLLFYEGGSANKKYSRCRIVVPSANLVPFDWGVGACMENMLFVIDLLPKDDGTSETSGYNTQFQRGLVEMLEAMQTPKDVLGKLNKFNFANTAPYGLVHTIGGSHIIPNERGQAGISTFLTPNQPTTNRNPSVPTPPQPARTGITNLSDNIRSLGLQLSRGDASFPPKLDFLTSSLGNLKQSFLSSLFLASCGNAPKIPARPTKVAKGFGSVKSDDSIQLEWQTILDNMKIYFPSQETVQESKGGSMSAGTICFQSKWWHDTSSEFPRELLSDCVGVRRDGILMHSKVLFVRYAKPKEIESVETTQNGYANTSFGSQPAARPSSGTTLYAGWVYLGSANLSESAWGSLVMDSKTKQPKLNCRNWESGVIIPVPLKPEHDGKSLHELTLEEVFGDILPVPIEYPGINMLASGRNPWFFKG